jgi:7-carboxy-7-deazaguanine synthase
MKIYEIFYSIQGEGKWTGLPNIFIRTTGCNLRCSYCDTAYAYYSKKEMNLEEIISKINKYNCNYIYITGGEPLLQKNINELINILIKKGYKIGIETNGSIDIKKISENKSVMISLDIKCPSSNMHKKMLFHNITYLGQGDQLKFIIVDKEDYNYAKTIINKYCPICSIFFQTVDNINLKKLANWILKDGLNIRMGLQIHKIIWGKMSGV